MEQITQDLLNEYSHYLEKIDEIKYQLFDKAEEICEWENLHIGRNHEHHKWKLDSI